MDKLKMIVQGLIKSVDYQTAVLPHLKPEYFNEFPSAESVFNLIVRFITKYERSPTVESLLIELDSVKATEKTITEAKDFIKECDGIWNFDIEWAIDETEIWCQERALNLAVLTAIEKIENPKKHAGIDLPTVFSDALSVHFDTTVGHDYFSDFDSQYDYYVSPETRIPFDIEAFNVMTKDGVTKKTLNVLMSTRTGGFKTGTMCHLAAAYIKAGYNVMYFTLEMSENKIRERIDANLLDIDIDDLPTVNKEFYVGQIRKLRESVKGNLIIREFPTGGAHCGHFRYAIKEAKSKKGFEPHVLILDYLNIAASQRLPAAESGNSYRWVKSIAEEFRALNCEFNTAGWTGTQSNRKGIEAGENLDLDNISESIGLASTADLILGVISSDELDKARVIGYKQIKNRYAPKDRLAFVELQVDKGRMKLSDKPGAKYNATRIKSGGQFIPPSAKTKTMEKTEGWTV